MARLLVGALSVVADRCQPSPSQALSGALLPLIDATMVDPIAPTARAPRLALALGLAGLLPALAALVLTRDPEWRFSALSLGFAYVALILSFLGGLWWGLAARAERAPGWLWVAAVSPSLVALTGFWPWAFGDPWPGPSFIWLGAALIAALGVDVALVRQALAPRWWLSLRLPLSLGLGLISIALGLA
ncbi:DUF3429 domain-containing protein [Sphingomonas sp. GlSt437]|uniref:DUF3429 domain-containing protein n=1 Tax=Sphingomonas sp. GlSt437 TaxID=3389970 RepID=UPI003A895BB9